MRRHEKLRTLRLWLVLLGTGRVAQPQISAVSPSHRDTRSQSCGFQFAAVQIAGMTAGPPWPVAGR